MWDDFPVAIDEYQKEQEDVMKQESTCLATEICAADGEMQTDLSCKRVLALKEILARILHKVVKEFENYTPEEIAEQFLSNAKIDLFKNVSPGMTNQKERVDGNPTENSVPNEGTVYFDVNATVVLPDEYRTLTQIFLHIDVEAQKDYRPGYPIEKRGIYYISRMLSSQLEKISAGISYAGIQKVYSIWICLGEHIPKKEQQTISRIYLTKEDLVGHVEMQKENYDLLELILIRLGDKETEDEFLGMLTTLLWKKMSAKERMSELEQRYGIPMKREVEEEVEKMCSYSAALRERAEREGRAEGRAQGRAEAICVVLETMGKLPEKLRTRILAEQDTEVLNSWLKLAKQVDTIEEFGEKIH